MSIRLQILLPILGVALGGLLLVGAQMWVIAAQSAETAEVLDRALAGGESARQARTAFRDLDALVGEVTAMTHFVDPQDVAKRFQASTGVVAHALGDLKARALSKETADIADKTLAGFALWRHDAAVTLGVEQAANAPVADVLARKREAITQLLVDVTQATNRDARAQTLGVAERQRMALRLTVGLALAFGAVAVFAAWRVASGMARPIRALVAGAERLAGGDVSVEFAATSRRDEIGDIARAVAAFRDNVTKAQAAETAAADERASAETLRVAAEAQRAATAGEQARVVDALSEGLERLAKGDLTCRVEGEFSPAYARLKTNFNTSLDVLQQALAAIAEGAHELQAGSSEIAGLAADLSSRTGTQTASIEEAAAALEEITSTVRATADHAGAARAVVGRTREEAEKSGAVVRTAVEAIGRIRNSSQQIEKIIGVIDEIAFQTNLLALNAGVEAARAGESGRGFAVVATEVRALAQRSADASREIKTLISASSSEVKQGVDLVVSAGSALDRIFAEVGEIDRAVGAIASGAAEQATGLQSVNTGVSQIDRVNQSNVDIVERTTAACANAAERAEELAQAVAMFRLRAEAPAKVRRAA